MNIGKSLCKAPGYKMSSAQVLLLAAASLAATPAIAVTYNLVAAPFVKAMPGGPVTMWGYALDGASCVPVPPATTCPASVPGPALTVPPGDPVLTVNLRNALTTPTSIVISGLPLPVTTPAGPVMLTDGQGRQRVQSFTAEAAPLATQTYTWNNPAPGTYLYQSGTHPAVQVQMGLYGAVKTDAVAGAIYNGVTYDNEATLLFSEIDPALHEAVANGSYGTAPTSTIDYAPKYFLINGEPYSAGAPPIPAGASGQKTLLRFLNAGLKTHSPVIQGTHVRLVAEDGKPYPYTREQYSVFLPAGKTVDAIMSPSGAAATYPVYDRRLNLTNGAVPDGGMLTYLAVAGTTTGAPTAVGDAYAATEDTLLSVAAPGVLANDTGTTALTAVLVGSTSHGALTFAADGSFGYTPAANFSGTDSFTYRASDGAQTSDPAAVTISVAPVNDPPVAANNAYSIVQGGTLAVAAPGVLGNDSDPDGDALTAALVTGPAAGTLTFNADGSFNYVAPATTGTHSFTYTASDGTLASNAATVTLTVFANKAPVAVGDTVSAPARTTVAYTPRIITVLANDYDPDAPANTIDPATVVISTNPNKGGTVTVNADGTINYTPRQAFRGTETFRYRVRDTLGTLSNAAYVRVNVR